MIMEEQKEAFLKELIEVCRKHNLSLAHEDHQGAFFVCPFREEIIEWLGAAWIEEDTTLYEGSKDV